MTSVLRMISLTILVLGYVIAAPLSKTTVASASVTNALTKIADKIAPIPTDEAKRFIALGQKVVAAHKNPNVGSSNLPEEFIEFGAHTLVNAAFTAAGPIVSPIAGKLFGKKVHNRLDTEMKKHFAKTHLQAKAMQVNREHSRAGQRSKVTKKETKQVVTKQKRNVKY